MRCKCPKHSICVSLIQELQTNVPLNYVLKHIVKFRDNSLVSPIFDATTVTPFYFTLIDQPEEEQAEKKAVVITARVHPGESQASWMMRGVIDYISGPSPEAALLRDKFIFKIVPMLNPDGVIVGNYRCSLAARDLNRNYRRPRKESFPTVWHTKNMIESVAEKHEVCYYLLYEFKKNNLN